MYFWGLVLIIFVAPIVLWRRTKPSIFIYILPVAIVSISFYTSIAGLAFPGGLIFLLIMSTCSAFLAGLLIAFIWREMIKQRD